LGWSIFFIQRLLGLIGTFNYTKAILTLRYTLYFVSIFLFVLGMHSFIRREIRRWWTVGFAISIIYTVTAIIINLPYNMIFIFPSIILIWSGINIIKAKKITRIGKHLVGWDFIVWGIYLIGYLTLGSIEWMRPFGNVISSLVVNIFAFGILILYFETIFDSLKKSEERYKLLVELCPDGIFVVNDNKITFANSAGLKLLNADNKEKVIGHPIEKFVHPDNLEYVEESLGELLAAKKQQHNSEMRIIAIDDKVVETETAAVLLPYDNKVSILGTARDIAVRRRAEKLKKGIEEKTRLLKEAEEIENLRNEFFANISHELRTPLNIMLGTLQLREMYYKDKPSEEKNPKEEKRIRVIKQNCYRLLRLVNNLIDITKIDAGFYETNFQNCNVINIIENISLSVVDYVENKDITLTFDTDVEEKIIACDPDKIERIMLNLLSNAIKFTKENGKILVSIMGKLDSVRISIKDNGIGIPKEKQHMIFERFKQVEKTLSRSNEGSGIGLSLVKALVEIHGGTIVVESEYRRGTEFIIDLPAKLVSEKNIIKNNDFEVDQVSIERINIEFSDIYGA